MKISDLRHPLREQTSVFAQFSTKTIPVGSVVHHGTDRKVENFDGTDPWLNFWVSWNPKIATEYATYGRSGDRGPPRLLRYKVKKPMALVDFGDDEQAAEDIFRETFYEDVEELANAVCDAGYDGWVWPSLEEFLICYPQEHLEYLDEKKLGEPKVQPSMPKPQRNLNPEEILQAISKSGFFRESIYYDPSTPKEGLIYRWVEGGKAASNLKTNSLNPGQWVHYLPPPVAKEGYLEPRRGISFGLNPKHWGAGFNSKSDLCFIVDRSKLNPKKVVEFPGQAAYDLTLDVGPNPPDYQRSYPVPIQNAHPGPLESFERDTPDEVFYMGIIRPLNAVLVQILMRKTATPAMRKKVEAYVQKFGTEVKEI